MRSITPCRRSAGLFVLAVACFAALEAAALAHPQQSRNDETPDVIFARVPEKARAKLNPFENDSEAAIAGKKLFGQHCAECHGQAADGSRRGPALRQNGLQRGTPGEIFWILTNGIVRRGMPAWSKLPDAQRWQIVVYLRALNRSPSETGAGHPTMKSHRP